MPRFSITWGSFTTSWVEGQRRPPRCGGPSRPIATSPKPRGPERCSRPAVAEATLMPTLGGGAYAEEAFQHFLAAERKRAERSGCLLLLLLVDLEGPPGVSAHIDRVIAAKLFSDLGRCLRETDFIGWYREERVAGAVLTELRDGPATEVARRVGQRVRGALGDGL